MKVLLTLAIQKTIELPIELDADQDEWPIEYMKERDKLIDALSELGWLVDIQSEDE